MNAKMWGIVCAVAVGILVADGSHAQAKKNAPAKPLTATPIPSGPATPVKSDPIADALATGLQWQKTPGKELDARGLLNRVYDHPLTTANQKAQARTALAELNKTTVFSTKVFDGDAIAYTYTVRQGDTLAALAKRSGCPMDLITQINGLKATGLRAGSTIKLLRGPFHAQVNKAACTLEVFARDTDGTKTLLLHARVSVGKNNSTPEGNFRIADKAAKATWYPPASMKAAHPNPVKWGEKGYPLGKDGLFMRLTGTEPATEKFKSIGLHSTSDQSSIGQARSSGCVRIGDKDVRQAYNLLTIGSDVKITP